MPDNDDSTPPMDLGARDYQVLEQQLLVRGEATLFFCRQLGGSGGGGGGRGCGSSQLKCDRVHA